MRVKTNQKKLSKQGRVFHRLIRLIGEVLQKANFIKDIKPKIIYYEKFK